MKTESNEILGHREGEDIQLQSIPSHHLAPWGFRPQIAEAASCMDLPTILIPKENPSSEMPTSHIRPGRRYESRSRLDCSVVNLPQQQAQTRTHWWRIAMTMPILAQMTYNTATPPHKEETTRPSANQPNLRTEGNSTNYMAISPGTTKYSATEKRFPAHTHRRQYSKIATPQVSTKNSSNYPPKTVLHNGNP